MQFIIYTWILKMLVAASEEGIFKGLGLASETWPSLWYM